MKRVDENWGNWKEERLELGRPGSCDKASKTRLNTNLHGIQVAQPAKQTLASEHFRANPTTRTVLALKIFLSSNLKPNVKSTKNLGKGYCGLSLNLVNFKQTQRQGSST